MAERYVKVYTLDGMMYTAGSPVILSAGVLLKDTLTGNVSALLKWQNISERRIKAATVVVELYDVAGNPTGEVITHQYLDFLVGRDGFFGAKEPLAVSNFTVRSFLASVREVIFEDNSVWRNEGCSSLSLPPQTPLASLFTRGEARDEFLLSFGTQCEYAVRVHGDIWQCACGAVNHADEAMCHACGNGLHAMTAVSEDMLYAANIYRNACALAEGNTIGEVEQAIAMFESIGDWNDAHVRVQRCYSRIQEFHEQKKRQQAQRAARRAKRKQILTLSGILAVAATIILLVVFFVAIPQQQIARYGEEAYDIVKKSEVGDRIIYGRYEQDGMLENGTEPIEWTVLAKEKNRVLVVSNYVLDCQPYNASGNYTRWEDSSIKQWTNHTFVEAAFTVREQRSILEAFLLSNAEVGQYMSPLNISVGVCTNHVLQNTKIVDKNGVCRWWSRVVAHGEACARFVDYDGRAGAYAANMGSVTIGVRPAMWISLDT